MKRVAHAGVCRFSRSNKNNIVFDYGKGCFVYDTEGKSYIDFVLGYGPVILGHSNQEFNEILTNFIKKGIHLPGYSHWHELYAQRLLGVHSKKFLVSFFKTGSESVSAALRLSSLITGKKGIIRCGYVGWHDALVGNSVRWHESLESPLRQEIRYMSGIRGIGPEEPVLNWINLDIEELYKLVSCNCDRIGAFVFDAYQIYFSSIDIFKKAIDLCRKNNILILCDETKTGGRISKLGIAIDEMLNVDMIILGKSLANGAPLSLLIGKDEILKYSEEARITGTFSKELLSIYCALATLDIMEKRSGYEIIKNYGQKVVDIINEVSKEIGIIDVVKARPVFGGSLFNIEYTKPILEDSKMRGLFMQCLADNNLLILQGHPSFICIDHENIDFGYLYELIYNGLKVWKTHIRI